MNRKTVISFLSAAVALYGCTDVSSLGTLEEYGTSSRLDIVFDWSGTSLSEGERPDSLTVIMGCEVDSLRYSRKLGSVGTTPQDSVVVPNGEWLCVAFNPDAPGVLYSGLDAFMRGDSISLKSMTARLDTLSPGEELALCGPVDPNPVVPSFKPVSGVVYSFARTRVNGVQENSVVLEMQDALVPVTFNVKVKTEPGVDVDRMLGIVSGVPGEVSLMSREVLAVGTGKSAFDIVPLDGGLGQMWTGTVVVPGIIAPQTGDVIIGDGILNVKVYVTVDDRKMMCIASLNLKTILDAQPVLIATDRAGVYRPDKGTDHILDIPVTLWLTPEGVQPGADGSGVVDWVSQAKIYNVI